jgi:hypothetical protein
MRFGWALFALLACAWNYTPALSATIKVGDEYDGGCYPFGCFAQDNGTVFQQVYTSSAFSGPVSIKAISFHDYYSNGFDMGDAVYSVKFYLTEKPVWGLDTDLSSNLGSLIGDFGSFNVAGPNPDDLTLTGNSVNYDPRWGNLLMQVIPTSVTRTACCAYWDVDYPPYYLGHAPATSSMWSSKWGAQPSEGLVTSFTIDPISAVPEPGSWAMMIVGFGLVSDPKLS